MLTLLRDMGLPVEERRITIDEVFEAHATGTLQGGAGVGTAAVIAPLGRLRHKDREITVPHDPRLATRPRRRRTRRHPHRSRTGPSRVDDGRFRDREIWRSGEVVIWRSESDDVSIGLLPVKLISTK